MTNITSPGRYGLLLSVVLHLALLGAWLGNSPRGPLSTEGLVEVEMLEWPSSSGKDLAPPEPTARPARRVVKRQAAPLPVLPKSPDTDGEKSALPVTKNSQQSAAGTTGVASNAVAHIYGEDQVDESPRLLREPKLEYPSQALRDGVESDVLLLLVVDVSGIVKEAKVVKRVGEGFDESALRAARALHFSAGIKQGNPVAVRIQWTCRFRLEG